MMTKRIAMAAALAALAGVALAQQGQPRGKAEATINGKKVVIDYGRPALKGRTLDALMKDLPEDRIWRAGENQVTTLDTQTALNIGGKPVPAGKYSLYVHAPAQGDWALVINKNLGIPLGEIWGEAPAEMKKEMWPRLDGYSKVAKDEVARIPLKKATGAPADIFTISIKGDALTLSWGDTHWGTTIKAGT
jgi:Protein of unknown function (DUF2911)